MKKKSVLNYIALVPFLSLGLIVNITQAQSLLNVNIGTTPLNLNSTNTSNINSNNSNNNNSSNSSTSISIGGVRITQPNNNNNINNNNISNNNFPNANELSKDISKQEKSNIENDKLAFDKKEKELEKNNVKDKVEQTLPTLNTVSQSNINNTTDILNKEKNNKTKKLVYNEGSIDYYTKLGEENLMKQLKESNVKFNNK